MATGNDSDIDLERMSDVDNLMWIVERNPLLKSTITAMTMLEYAPDRTDMEQRIENVTIAVPRLRQRVVANPVSIAPPRWELDPGFHLADHVTWVELDEGHNSIDEALIIVEDLAEQPFDKTKALWKFVFLTNFDTGEAAFISKLHHSLADGLGSVKLMLELFDLEPEADPRPPEQPAPKAKPKSQSERVVQAIAHERDRGATSLRQTREAVKALPDSPAERAKVVTETAASIGKTLRPANQPLSPLMSRRSAELDFRTLAIPIADLKAAARLAGSRMNAAFVAGVIGAMKIYHDEHATPVDKLRMGMPISTRSDDDSATTNSFAATRIEVPLTIDDPIELMQHLDELVAEAREDPALGLGEAAAGVLSRLPKRLTTGLFEKAMKGIDFSTSNVPGVPIPVYLGGVPVVSQYPFGPVSGSAVNITLLSYIDTAYVGVSIDSAAIPDGDVFHNALSTSFTTLVDLA